MKTNIKIDICLSSPPDREKLVADIIIDNHQIVEINQEKEELELIIYPKNNSEPWVLSFEEFIKTLKEAKKKLRGCTR